MNRRDKPLLPKELNGCIQEMRDRKLEIHDSREPVDGPCSVCGGDAEQPLPARYVVSPSLGNLGPMCPACYSSVLRGWAEDGFVPRIGIAPSE